MAADTYWMITVGPGTIAGQYNPPLETEFEKEGPDKDADAVCMGGRRI